jgi:hypothetical protein
MRGDIRRRLEQLTGQRIDDLSTRWHRSLRDRYASAGGAHPAVPLLSTARGGGRLNLAASLSPDGSRVVFLSERDQFSIDLFLADAQTGAVIRKLITTATEPAFESLQYLHSAGAWDPSGTSFALAAVRNGRATLVLTDTTGKGPARELPFDAFDEVYSPAWSPDGRTIAFAAMVDGTTDLFTVDLESGNVRRLTTDQYADLQPNWSPDGTRLVFSTDRFTTDLAGLRWGPLQIVIVDVASGAMTAVPAQGVTAQRDPSWSPDGSSIYFVADEQAVSNVYRVAVADGQVYRITDAAAGVSGVTRLSPALSVASSAGVVAYSVFHKGTYEIHTVREPAALAGTLVPVTATAEAPRPALEIAPQPVPQLPRIVEPKTEAAAQRYRPTLGLEMLGSPYFSAGGGSFGSYVRGGMSMLFGDLLGNRQLFGAAELSNRLDESAFTATYVDRGSRWNWGSTIAQVPQVGRASTAALASPDGQTLTRRRDRLVWTDRSASVFAAYPLDRSRRIEFSAGMRQTTFDREAETDVVSLVTGRRVETRTESIPQLSAAKLAETAVALVGDSALFGATGPILGNRYRLQVTPAFGGISYTGVLADYRAYVMPVRPYTLAVRVFHSARYGAGGADPRLLQTYLGAPSLVRGYGSGRVARSECTGVACPALNGLIGTGVLVGKVELRVPVSGALSSRVKYGPVPVDAFLFADAGTTWGGTGRRARWETLSESLVRSVGAGVRVNAMGMIVEVSAVRALDLQRGGWKFGFDLRPGF